MGLNHYLYTVYYRENCHLCEDMLEQLNPLIHQYNLQLSLVDVDSNQKLQKQYGLSVPVLCYNEGDKQVELCKYFLDVEVFTSFIQKSN